MLPTKRQGPFPLLVGRRHRRWCKEEALGVEVRAHHLISIVHVQTRPMGLNRVSLPRLLIAMAKVVLPPHPSWPVTTRVQLQHNTPQHTRENRLRHLRFVHTRLDTRL